MSNFETLAPTSKKSRRNLWFERVMALVALANLGIVLFDLSYVPWRNFYLRVPSITKRYDKIKGIEPHRETQNYLDTVEKLKTQVATTELQSPQVKPLLQDLRNLSIEMINTNPFAEANKTGTLEKIKDRMRRHVPNKDNSAKQAFQVYWSQTYLSKKGWQNEINFYDKKIEPLIASNYFRHVGENSNFADDFWKIDIWFIGLFALEFLARTYYLHRRHTGLRWFEAMLWRWYDIFLLVPFLGLMRIIPVAIRLHQAQLINLNFIQKQVNQGLVANFAGELTEVVVIRVINQFQDSIRRGDISRLLSGRKARPYIDINNVNEVEAIANLLVNVVVYQVLPKVQPDLEAILRHSLEKTLNQIPIYQNLQHIPGMANLPHQAIERLVSEITQTAYKALTDSLEDTTGAELTSRLVQHFGEALGSEVQKQQTVQKIQSLLSDFLEEVKLNYVEQLSEQDLEAVLDQRRQIRQIVKP